jgi:hypothetical protein
MPPKSILKKTSKPIPGTRTASGKRVRPGQNLRKAAAAEKESEKSKGSGQGKGKGRFDKKLAAGGKYEKYLGPGEYTGPTGGNAGPLGTPGAAKDAKGGKDGGKGKGKGKKTVTMAVRKDKSNEDEDGFGDEDGSGSEGSGGEGTDEELGKGKSSKSNGNSMSTFLPFLTSIPYASSPLIFLDHLQNPTVEKRNPFLAASMIYISQDRANSQNVKDQLQLPNSEIP